MGASRPWRRTVAAVTRSGLFVCLVLLAGARPATAQWVLLQPFIGIGFGGDTTIVDLEDATKLRKAVYGGTVTVIGRRAVGAEVDFGYVPRFFQRSDGASDDPEVLVTDSHVVTLMGNVVLATPLRWTGDSLRPYVSGGAGLVRTPISDFREFFSGARLEFVGINVGGGAIGFFNERVGVRWDLRYFRTVSSLDEESDDVALGTARLSFWRATTALVLKY